MTKLKQNKQWTIISPYVHIFIWKIICASWLTLDDCTNKGRKSVLPNNETASTSSWETDGKSRNKTENEHEVEFSSDRSELRGITGSPQSQLSELQWRQLSAEAQKMKRRLGAGPLLLRLAACVCLCPLKSSTPPCSLQYPALHPAAPAIWCTECA